MQLNIAQQFRGYADSCRSRCVVGIVLATSVLIAGLAALPGWAQRSDGGAAGASEDRYVALVIGNGRYDGALALEQPAADAAAIAQRLRARGFRITAPLPGGGCGEGAPQVDLSREAMQAAIACFLTQSRNARQAVLYFSGHAARIAGRDYLVPTGAAAPLAPPDTQLVPLAPMLEALQQAKPALAIVLLDAPRKSIRQLAENASGLGRTAATGAARITAYAAPVGGWADDEAAGLRARARRSGDSEPDAAATAVKDAPLSPYTRRLVQLLDDDLDVRSLGQAGHDARTLLLRASAEVMIENVATPDMLGRMPKLGSSACDVIAWRAENLNRCIEIAAAYEHCGKQRGIADRLQKQCRAEWGTLVKYSLRSAMAGAMKAGKCQAFKTVISQFESEPSIAGLAEFQEMRSLAQYSCAVETAEKLKKGFAEVMAAQDCQRTQRFLAEGKEVMERDMRGQIEKLAKQVCCPEVGFGKECVTRKAATARIVSKLESKGCLMGATAETKSARAMYLMNRINTESRLGLDLAAHGVPLETIWARLETLRKEECSCPPNEGISSSGACACQLYAANDPPRCFDRERAIRIIQEGLQTWGCDIGSVDGKLSEKTTRFVARLRHFDSAITFKEMAPQSFAQMERLLYRGKFDAKRLCAPYAVDEKLAPNQRRVLQRAAADAQDQPYAAVAVATTCAASGCEWASVVGQPDAEAARSKALEQCQQKAKSCVLGASHRPSGTP